MLRKRGSEVGKAKRDDSLSGDAGRHGGLSDIVSPSSVSRPNSAMAKAQAKWTGAEYERLAGRMLVLANTATRPARNRMMRLLLRITRAERLHAPKTWDEREARNRQKADAVRRMIAYLERNQARMPYAQRPMCGAKTRAGGTCAMRVVMTEDGTAPKSKRCRMHGGLSTGPRTAEGKARVAEATRSRHAAQRAARAAREAIPNG